MVRAKFICEENKLSGANGSTIRMRAVTSGSRENDSFFKATPSGTLVMDVVNEAAANQLTVGKSYYLDITEADVPSSE